MPDKTHGSKIPDMPLVILKLQRPINVNICIIHIHVRNYDIGSKLIAYQFVASVEKWRLKEKGINVA